jgi:thiol-disulfide isomerase/thioredoxin
MKYLICLLLLAIALPSPAQQQKNTFTLNGKVSGLTGKKLYLIYDNINGENIKDSVIVSGNSFRFQGKIAEPTFAFLLTEDLIKGKPEASMTSFFLEPAVIELTASNGTLVVAKIKASVAQAEFDELLQEYDHIENRWKVVLDSLAVIGKRNFQEADDLRSWILTPYDNEYTEAKMAFFRRKPASFVTAYLLTNNRDISTDSMKSIYSRFPDKIKNSKYGKSLGLEIQKRGLGIPGTTATLFSALDVKGTTLSLSDYKGKYVLLDFWASWCVPCRKGNPHLLTQYTKYKTKGLEIIGVSDDDARPEAWKKAIEEDHIGVWKHVLRGATVSPSGTMSNVSNAITEKYNVQSYPTKILIDGKGMIIGSYSGGPDDEELLDRKLAEVFNK